MPDDAENKERGTKGGERTQDAELLRSYAATGAEAAFAELVGRHLDGVYSAALRRVGGDAHFAEDVAQQVFIALARKAGTLAGHPFLGAWLYTTTRHEAANVVRHERRRKAREQLALTMNETTGFENTSVADWSRVAPVLDAAIDRLGESDRAAIVMRFVERRGFSEIGAALQLSEDAARMRVDRALDKLHALLAKRGVTSTASALGVALANQAVATAPVGLAASVTGAALGGAAAAGGGSTGAITGGIGFMSTSKIVSSVAVVAVFLALAVGVYEVRAGRIAEAALTAERREVFALAARVNKAEGQAKEALRQLAGEQRSPADSSAAAAATAPEAEVRGPFGPEPPGSRARGRALMDAYPEIRRLVVQSRRAYFSSQYQRLYQELGLTGAQIDAFEMIMIAGVSSTYPVMGTVTLDAAPVMPWAEKEARLREILGERGFQRFEEYQRSPQDFRVAQLASALYFTDTPLTAEQAGQFQRLIVERNRAGRDQPPTEYWATVRVAAAAFLAEPQLAALRGLQANDEFNIAREQNQRLRPASQPAGSK